MAAARVVTGQAELVHEAALQRAIGALAASAGLRRIAEDVFDAQARQGPADLRRTPAIRPAAGHRGVHGPMGPVGVQGHRHPLGLEHGAQRRHDRLHALAALPELGVEQPLGGVVDDSDEGEPPVRDERQPAVAAAVQVQELAEAGPWFAPPAVAAPGAVFGHQPRTLQGLLDEGITEAHAVLPAGELVEVAHIEPLVALAVEGQQALHFGHRGPLGRGRPAAAIEQAVIAAVLEEPPQPPNAPRAAPQDLGRLDPR